MRYNIYSGDPNGYFSINSQSGVISTASSLDHESHPFVLLNVLATTGNPPTYGHTQVSRLVERVEWAAFVEGVRSAEVFSDGGLGTPSAACVLIAMPLRRVELIDSLIGWRESPHVSSRRQVNISIWDVNDNAPEFDVSSVKISVRENAVLNEAIYAAHALDHDSGDNGVVTYELVQNPGKMFLIDKVGSSSPFS